MSNLSNDLHVEEKAAYKKESPTPQKVILVTTLLLISGLLFTGLLMMNYVTSNNSDLTSSEVQADQGDGSKNQAASFFNTLNNEKSAKNTTVSSDVTSDHSPGVVDKFFGKRDTAPKWPKLKMTGFGTSAGGRESFAFINGKKYHTGDLISGKVTILEIRQHDVLVEYAGETQHLKMHTNL